MAIAARQNMTIVHKHFLLLVYYKRIHRKNRTGRCLFSEMVLFFRKQEMESHYILR